MKLINLVTVFLFLPLFANAGLGGTGYRDCSTHTSDSESFRLTVQDVASSLNLSPTELFAPDSHFITGLTELEKQQNIVGEGKYGSYKTILLIEHNCKSANGGIKMTLTAPHQFSDSNIQKIIGNTDREIIDTEVEQTVYNDRIELVGSYLKVVIDLKDASLPELMRKGRFSKNIKVSILNLATGTEVEGINKL